jgi:hypothetical protein
MDMTATQQAAVAAYLAEQKEARENRRQPAGLRVIANQFGINYRALGKHVKGGKTKQEWVDGISHLNHTEALVLIDFAIGMADRGFPLTHNSLAHYALEIKHIRDPDAKKCGSSWTQKFLAKYGQHISMKWSTSLDTVHASAVNPTNVKLWFDLVKKVRDTYKFCPRNIYNFDKSGFPIGKGSKHRVITRPGTKIQHAVEDGNRENVTVMCTVCADGTVLPPVVIFKGQYFLEKWCQNNPIGAAYVLK